MFCVVDAGRYLPRADMDPAARRTLARRAARNLARTLDGVAEAVWVVDAHYELIFLNAAAAAWLQTPAEELLGRRCHVAAERTTPHDELAAALAPPLGLRAGTAITVSLQPPGTTSRQVRYLQIGAGPERLIVAVSGAAEPQTDVVELEVAQRLRQRVQHWRRQDAAVGLVAAAGSSAQALRLRQQVLLASATRQHAAIIGPRGCGGEAIARRIHAAAVHAGAEPDPAIVVDTPLMDAELLEATLSPAAAHLRGDSKRSVTLILRGVDDSPLEVQQRVLEFAQRGPAVRLIGLLSAAAAPVPAAAEGEPALTAEMALTLSVLEIVVAPLADRSEDIPLIATALLETRHAAGDAVAERFSAATLDQLLIYPWPGNFEELDAAVRHAAAVCRGAAIEPEHLPLAIRSFRLNPARSTPLIVETNLDEELRRFELEKIQAALEAAEGNRSEAARLLGISRARLLRRLDDTDSPAQAEP